MDVQIGSRVAVAPAAPVIPAEPLADSGPAQLWQKDNEIVQVTALFGVESWAGQKEGWELECRIDENGWGSPFIWHDAQAALAWAVEASKEGGLDSVRVVVFTTAGRLAPKVCDACGQNGHAMADCSPDVVAMMKPVDLTPPV